MQLIIHTTLLLRDALVLQMDVQKNHYISVVQKRVKKTDHVTPH